MLCDGAPDVIGLNDVDEHLQNELVRKAWSMAEAILARGGRRGRETRDFASTRTARGRETRAASGRREPPSLGGCFASKVYRGRDATALLESLREHFRSVVVAKPRCSRSASAEAFVVCRGFGEAPGDAEKRVPFVACGGDDAFDADASFPLDLPTAAAYEYRGPVQMPIRPPHEDAGAGPPPPPAPAAATAAASTTAPEGFRYDGDVRPARGDAPPPATDAASLRAWVS